MGAPTDGGMSDLDRDDGRPAMPDVLVIAPDGGRRNRRRALPVAALAATVAIAGGTYAATRGSDSTVDQARPAASVTQLVHGAASSVEQAKSSKFAMTMDMQFAGQSMQITGDGAFDYKSQAGDITMTIPSAGTMRMVMEPGTLYMKMSGELAEGLPGGKPWLKIDLDKLGQMSGIDLQSLMEQAQQQNPAENLKMLTDAAGITVVGHEKVRGTPTTHYAGQVTMADMAKFYKGQLADQLDQLGSRIAKQAIPVDVWIGDDGLPRRMAMSFAVEGTMTMKMQMDMFDFGTPVHVSPPPADQVTDFTALLSSGA